MKIVAVTGRRGSGKTSLIEGIIEKLHDKLNIAVIKHIHHRDFEVDKIGKDTWRFKNAGAKMVIGISPERIFLNADLKCEDLGVALNLVRMLSQRLNVDLIFLEGFYSQVQKLSDVSRILITKNLDEVKEMISDNVAKSKELVIFCKECRDNNFKGIPIYHSLDEIVKYILLLLAKKKKA